MGVSRDCPIFFPVDPVISPTGKATNFAFGRYIHSVYPTKRLLKIWEKRERGCIQGWPKFCSTPYYLQNAHIYEVQIWHVHSQRPCETKAVKNLGEKGAWVYPGMPKFIQYSVLSQEWVKLRTSNLAGIFRGSTRTKAP